MSRSTTGQRTDLGLVYVVSNGMRDTLFLANNGLKIATVLCRNDTVFRLEINPHFRRYPAEMKVEVFRQYVRWKHAAEPEVKIPPEIHGYTRDGHVHPFRRYPKAREKGET